MEQDYISEAPALWLHQALCECQAVSIHHQAKAVSPQQAISAVTLGQMHQK